MKSEQLVKQFFEEVRSGRHPERAAKYMAETVHAHQVISENTQTVVRTPQDYTDHVHEMIEAYGDFSVELQECIATDEKVYVRWKQIGTHIGIVDGYEPTGLPVIEIASAVYCIQNEKIVEYWIQIDRAGIETQLKQNKALD
ncbi:ester cyclase [Listeria booriae]|uniref:Ester cyclase n=1 Tax=Listeria booriae TaxID=1552123 RepID=A0A7X0XQY8_9LIST|nr:ester cyclase [Listeria booriae]MBC1779100.1 ester cyclase [Listeria booriae]MBC2390440.1 ester cyclase [Listeria booriae]